MCVHLHVIYNVFLHDFLSSLHSHNGVDQFLSQIAFSNGDVIVAIETEFSLNIALGWEVIGVERFVIFGAF